MNYKKLILGIAIIGMFVIPAGVELATAADGPIRYSEIATAVTIQTDYLNVKIVPDQGHLMWWSGRNNTDEMYKLQLVKIQEFDGNDTVLDDKFELLGQPYNLITGDWVYTIDEQENQLTITLSILGLPNGADMHLVMKVYATETPIEGTDRTVKALEEMKFDIIVDNWDFSENAQGYAIQTYLTELRSRNRVRVRNGTVAENGPNLRTMQFGYDGIENPTAFYAWTTFANIYDASDILVDTVDVGTAYFDDLASPPEEADGYQEGLAHLFLTYPNYGDDHKMVHDPIVGVNDQPVNLWIAVGLPVGTGLLLVGIIVSIVILRKR
ncbi:MAG: hypothetical protein FK733_13060 [Asgard group archaeon]|nr:hypothetical protein [Asgard group archaeon]